MGPQGPQGQIGAYRADGSPGVSKVHRERWGQAARKGRGATGATGPQGASWTDGPQGPAGAVGLGGAPGPVGLTGQPRDQRDSLPCSHGQEIRLPLILWYRTPSYGADRTNWTSGATGPAGSDAPNHTNELCLLYKLIGEDPTRAISGEPLPKIVFVTMHKLITVIWEVYQGLTRSVKP